MHTFHHYYLISHIARKTGRDIYLAYAVNEPEQHIVLKIFDAKCLMPTANSRAVQQVSQRLHLLKHPGIVALRTLGIADGKPYAVSAYLPTGSLRQYLVQHSSEGLSIDEAIGIVLQVGEAVAFAHTQGIVHQHIRPENIMFDEQGAVLLTDFSLGTIIDETQTEDKSDGRVVSYTAPEQFAGVVDPSNDQYALGCLLYELITGTLPFKANSQSGSGFTVAPTTLVPALSPAVETVLLRAIEVSPQKRYRDVAAFRKALKIASQPTEMPAFPFAHLTSEHPGGRVSSQEIPTLSHAPQSVDDVPDEAIPMLPELAVEEVDLPLESFVPPDSVEDISLQETRSDVLAESSGVLMEMRTGSAAPTEIFKREPHASALPQSDIPGVILPSRGNVQVVGRSRFLADKRHSWPLLAIAVVLVLIVLILTQVFNPVALGTISSVPHSAVTDAPSSIVPDHDALTSPTSIAIMSRTPTGATKPKSQPTAKPRRTPIPTPTLAVAQSAQPISPSSVGPSPTATPRPPTATPVVNVSASYEAESSLNTRTANIKEFTCSLCSGGLRIGWINGGDNLRFNAVTSARTGSYTLLVYYYNSIPNRVTELFVSVNGNANVEVGLQVATVDCCNYAPYVGSITITLQAGDNTILLSNPNGPAPDIDRIVVNPS